MTYELTVACITGVAVVFLDGSQIVLGAHGPF